MCEEEKSDIDPNIKKTAKLKKAVHYEDSLAISGKRAQEPEDVALSKENFGKLIKNVSQSEDASGIDFSYKPCLLS